jgi:DNA (cytosine-5)-methyltransferase 1
MTSANHDHIPLDAQGLRRSAKLPSMRGEFITLPPRLATPAYLEQWQERLHDPHAIVVLDLFCGAGGMSLGFEAAGCFPAVGVDQNSWAVMSHSYNFLSKGMVQDICAIPDPRAFIEELGIQRPIDIIIGGPPCQGFALIGRGKLKSLGPEKEAYYRNVLNNLYREFIRFVTELQPLAFVMENVPALAWYQDAEGSLLERIEQAFPGYVVASQPLNALDAGVPQRRSRLFIQGNCIGAPVRWPAEATLEPVTVEQAIGDLPVRAPGMLSDEAIPYQPCNGQTSYQQRMREGVPDDQTHVIWDHITRQLREDDKAIFAMMPQGGKYRDLPDEWKRYRQHGKNFADKYWRLVADEPAWTITAHIAKDAYRYIHPTQDRTLSVREFARLQSFPDRFRFCGPRTERLRQIGNAVPPLLAQSIARSIVEQIHTYRSEHDKDESEQIAEVNAIG